MLQGEYKTTKKKGYNKKNKEKIGYITCFSVFFLDICQINVIFGNLIKRKIMKKFLMVWSLLLFISITSYSQEKKYALYSAAFYNLENLFDTIHDAGKNDFEYLPNGKNKWNAMKYEAKPEKHV